MPKKGENIYKRKDGRWEGRYIHHRDAVGKAKYGYIYGKTYTDVKKILLQKKHDALYHTTIENPQNVLYAELLHRWLLAAKLHIKESSYARYVQLINTHIQPHLGIYRLSQLTTQTVEQFVEHLCFYGRLDGNGGLAPKTVIDILSIVKSSLEYAQYQNIPVTCNLKKLTVKNKEKEMRVLSPTEQELLVKTLLSEMDRYKFGVLLCLYTGIRIGELCALQWADFDLHSATFCIHKTIQRIRNTDDKSGAKTKVIITTPKSQCSIRQIPLPPFLLPIALRFQAAPETFILTGCADRFVEPRTMQNKFRAYIQQSGIAIANFHSLRHTFATRCIEVAFDLKSLSEILGHANVNITLNRYVHSSLDLKRANMNRLDFCVSTVNKAVNEV